jgi:hypothetical protein
MAALHYDLHRSFCHEQAFMRSPTLDNVHVPALPAPLAAHRRAWEMARVTEPWGPSPRHPHPTGLFLKRGLYALDDGEESGLCVALTQ